LEALTDAKVDVVSNEIDKVVADGIITKDGTHRRVDAIICATGFDTSFSPRFPIIGKNRVTLAEQWSTTPETYLAVATDNFPNYFISLGPNAALGTGNLLLLIENELEYVTKCVAKIQRDNIRSMVPRREAVSQFTRYCDSYFEGTVFTLDCRSWYKGGTSDGRVSALWPGKSGSSLLLVRWLTSLTLPPGSSLHAMKSFAHPRWEDFEYEYIQDNPFGWIGNGWTRNEKENNVNVDYLDLDQIDFPTIPEKEQCGKEHRNGDLSTAVTANGFH
jgi:hypothetical protein